MSDLVYSGFIIVLLVVSVDIGKSDGTLCWKLTEFFFEIVNLIELSSNKVGHRRDSDAKLNFNRSNSVHKDIIFAESNSFIFQNKKG